MTCDQAFDFLTDLERRDDRRLAQHLAGCPRCRGMAEALAPVLGLWREVASEEASPRENRVIDAGVAVRTPLVAAASSSRVEVGGSLVPSNRWNAIRHWIAAFAAGIVVAFGLQAVSGRAPEPRSLPTSGQPERCAWLDRQAIRSDDRTAQGVILSCVACHIQQPPANAVPPLTLIPIDDRFLAITSLPPRCPQAERGEFLPAARGGDQQC